MSVSDDGARWILKAEPESSDICPKVSNPQPSHTRKLI